MQYHSPLWTQVFMSCITLVTVAGIQDGDSSLDSAILEQENRTDLELSRRKRYLAFPEGSSLQLVFCLQASAVITIGDIFLFGNTAALAWELPKDPVMLFKGQKGPLRRKDDGGSTYYTDDTGDVIYKVPHKSRPFVPVFAKRSVDHPIPNTQETSKMPQRPLPPLNIDREKLHAPQRRRYFLKTEHMDERSIEFHRHSRRGLYEKLELFFKALGMNGRQCLLRMLCETGAGGSEGEEQGSIMEEMMRAVFTLHRGRQFDSEEHREYDSAHRTKRDCEQIYPNCNPLLTDLPPGFN